MNPESKTSAFLSSKPFYFLLAVLFAVLALYFVRGLFFATPQDTPPTATTSDTTVERIITLSKSPVPFVILGLDASDERLVGVNPSTQITMDSHVLKRFFPRFPSISSKICTEGFTPNIEEILRLDPDVVFLWERFQSTIEQMQGLGLNVMPLRYDGNESTDRAIVTTIAAAMDREEKADSIMQWREQTMRQIEAITKTFPQEERPKVIFLYSYESWEVGGESCYEDFCIKLAGGRNMGDGLGISRNMNIEQILEWNPDVIFFGGWRTFPIPAEFYANPLLAEVSAIKNQRVFKMPVWASNEAVLTWEWMAELLHPEAFDFTIRDDIKSVHAWQYGIDLTDDDLDAMLFYDVNAISPLYSDFKR